MRNTDLTIGDWVYASKDEHTVLKVMTINGNTADCIWDVNNECDMNIDEFEPIPLTPEILEKNGFYHEPNVGHKFEDYSGGIVICDTWNRRIKVLYNYDVIYDCDYTPFCVHTLQHIFRLCYIDKEIVL